MKYISLKMLFFCIKMYVIFCYLKKGQVDVIELGTMDHNAFRGMMFTPTIMEISHII
jgi:hypothetical protein